MRRFTAFTLMITVFFFVLSCEKEREIMPIASVQPAEICRAIIKEYLHISRYQESGKWKVFYKNNTGATDYQFTTDAVLNEESSPKNDEKYTILIEETNRQKSAPDNTNRMERYYDYMVLVEIVHPGGSGQMRVTLNPLNRTISATYIHEKSVTN